MTFMLLVPAPQALRIAVTEELTQIEVGLGVDALDPTHCVHAGNDAARVFSLWCRPCLRPFRASSQPVAVQVRELLPEQAQYCCPRHWCLRCQTTSARIRTRPHTHTHTTHTHARTRLRPPPPWSLRPAFISFHSLEDDLVRHRLKALVRTLVPRTHAAQLTRKGCMSQCIVCGCVVQSHRGRGEEGGAVEPKVRASVRR